MNLLRARGCDLRRCNFSGTQVRLIVPVKLRREVKLREVVPANLLYDGVLVAGRGDAYRGWDGWLLLGSTTADDGSDEAVSDLPQMRECRAAAGVRAAGTRRHGSGTGGQDRQRRLPGQRRWDRPELVLHP